jgi:hypothetical protein
MVQWQHLTPRLVLNAIARLGGRWRWLLDRGESPTLPPDRRPTLRRRRPGSGLVRLRRPF